MTLNLEQQRQLKIAQDKLSRGAWTFRQYSQHLTEFVYTLK